MYAKVFVNMHIHMLFYTLYTKQKANKSQYHELVTMQLVHKRVIKLHVRVCVLDVYPLLYVHCILFVYIVGSHCNMYSVTAHIVDCCSFVGT